MAVAIRKLSDEEAVAAFPKRGQLDLSEYEEALRDAQAGDAFELDINGTLTMRALKRRLGQAVKRTHNNAAHLKYKVLDTAEGQVLQFKVLVPASQTSARRKRSRRDS